MRLEASMWYVPDINQLKLLQVVEVTDTKVQRSAGCWEPIFPTPLPKTQMSVLPFTQPNHLQITGP